MLSQIWQLWRVPTIGLTPQASHVTPLCVCESSNIVCTTVRRFVFDTSSNGSICASPVPTNQSNHAATNDPTTHSNKKRPRTPSPQRPNYRQRIQAPVQTSSLDIPGFRAGIDQVHDMSGDENSFVFRFDCKKQLFCF